MLERGVTHMQLPWSLYFGEARTVAQVFDMYRYKKIDVALDSHKKIDYSNTTIPLFSPICIKVINKKTVISTVYKQKMMMNKFASLKIELLVIFRGSCKQEVGTLIIIGYGFVEVNANGRKMVD